VLVDLVQATTTDGVRLDGTFQAPAGSPAPGVGAFCLVHGTGGNFYSSALFDDLARRLLERGHAVLRVNTRGHDGVSTAQTLRGGKRQGAAYEAVDDCRHDITAWVEWLQRRTGPRVGLVGHSMGAVKCLYTLARAPSLGVACILALSPPRLSYEAFCSGPQASSFLQVYALADQYVQLGQPSTLMEVNLPLPMVITAAGYLEKYGPDERFNFLRFLAGVPCPTFIVLGSDEVEQNPAFRGLPEALAKMTGRLPGLRVETVPGADHFYTLARGELLRRVEDWLTNLPGEPRA
jgi:pimeloyl-ACP methyl ester carboxylesterase